jgi:hypothetical protein
LLLFRCAKLVLPLTQSSSEGIAREGVGGGVNATMHTPVALIRRLKKLRNKHLSLGQHVMEDDNA